MGKYLKSPLVLILIGWTIKSVMDGKSPIPGVPMFGLSGGYDEGKFKGVGAFTTQRIPGNVGNVGRSHPY